jgi:hypothetical protein
MKAELRILHTGAQKELLKVQQLRYVITEASGYATCHAAILSQ